MEQRGNSYLEPSQSASMPGKPVADQPSEPRLNRVKNLVRSEPILYHRLIRVSLSGFLLSSRGSFSQRSAFLQSFPEFRK